MAPALGTRFGEPWPAAGTPQAIPAATDRHYTGQRSFEASLGSLYHYQARWFSPVLGRFLSPDPLVPNPANPQNLNRYSYVSNNPLKYTDPSGYCKYAGNTGKFDFRAHCSIESWRDDSLADRARWMREFMAYWSAPKRGSESFDMGIIRLT